LAWRAVWLQRQNEADIGSAVILVANSVFEMVAKYSGGKTLA